MPPECLHFKEYIRAEVKMLRKQIDSHRKEMSRREGRDVSLKEAKTSYMELLLVGDAEKFRRLYCLKCSGRDECECRRDA